VAGVADVPCTAGTDVACAFTTAPTNIIPQTKATTTTRVVDIPRLLSDEPPSV